MGLLTLNPAADLTRSNRVNNFFRSSERSKMTSWMFQKLTAVASANDLEPFFTRKSVGVLIVNRWYEITDNTGADFTGVGAANNNVGTQFIATGTAPTWGTGEVAEMALLGNTVTISGVTDLETLNCKFLDYGFKVRLVASGAWTIKHANGSAGDALEFNLIDSSDITMAAGDEIVLQLRNDDKWHQIAGTGAAVIAGAVNPFIITGYADDGEFRARRANGAEGAPTKVVSGNEISVFSSYSYEEVTPAFALAGKISFFATEDHTATAKGSELRFYVTPNTTATPIETFTLEQNGGATLNLQTTGGGAAEFVINESGGADVFTVTDTGRIDFGGLNDGLVVSMFAQDNGTTMEEANIFWGYNAGGLGAAITTAKGNIGLGNNSLDALTSGWYNVAIGYNTLTSNLTGGYNIGIGFEALKFVTGNYNIGIGFGSGDAIVGGADNVLVGHNAGTRISSGSSNVVMGDSCGAYVTTGSNNVYIGQEVGFNGSNTSNNIAIGRRAGYALNGTTGKNILLGFNTAELLTSGTNNLMFGDNAGAESITSSFCTFLGTYAGLKETNNYRLYLHQGASPADLATGITTALVYGEFDNKIFRTNANNQIYAPAGSNLEALLLTQGDDNEPFIKYSGTTEAGATKSLSSWTAGNTIQGFIRADVNGADVWIAYYDAPTS